MRAGQARQAREMRLEAITCSTHLAILVFLARPARRPILFGTLHAELKWVKRPSSSRVVCLVYLVSYSRYGHGTQEGAESGDNSKKPGRPSHVYLTYQMEGLWLILGG